MRLLRRPQPPVDSFQTELDAAYTRLAEATRTKETAAVVATFMAALRTKLPEGTRLQLVSMAADSPVEGAVDPRVTLTLLARYTGPEIADPQALIEAAATEADVHLVDGALERIEDDISEQDTDA